MRKVADRFVNALLRIAPWYRPDEIEAREANTERVHRYSIRARIGGETALASYRRAKVGR